MGNPRAKATVVLRDPHGEVRVFEEGAALPQWAVAEITNPDVVDMDEDAKGAASADPDDGPPPVDEPKPRTRARRTPAKK